MNNRIIVSGIILLFIFPILIQNISGDTLILKNKNHLEFNNPILHFYFDKQSWLLYLENIGDETVYNITISIQITGFIVFGNEEDFSYREQPLEPGQRRAIIYIPLVFGFGPIKLIYTARAVNADANSITLKAFLIGPWPWLWGYYEK